MALQTSPEHPAPVRVIANAIAGYIDRLGAVWVEGQVAQVSRRQGMSTVFLTFRDPVADVSLSVTCSRQLFDSLNPPLVEGASVVLHAKPSYYANRGTLSLFATGCEKLSCGVGMVKSRVPAASFRSVRFCVSEAPVRSSDEKLVGVAVMSGAPSVAPGATFESPPALLNSSKALIAK